MIHNIPPILHFIFLSKEEHRAPVFRTLEEKEALLPEQFKAYYQYAKELHANWKIFIHNEYDAQQLLHNHLPELLPLYNNYQHPVQKSDILRVILIYLLGGFYLDLDILCLKKLDGLLEHDLVLAKEKIITRDKAFFLGATQTMRVANYMFGGKPQHPFWLCFLKECVKMANREIIYEYDITKSTGPDLLTNLYHAIKHRYKDITLLDNIDRKCTVSWHEAISCYFGNYATHLHMGSWRWEGKKSTIRNENPLPDEERNKARRALTLKLKTNAWPHDELIVLKTDNKEYQYAAGYRQLYTKFRNTCKTLSNTRQITGEKILVFGNPKTCKNSIADANINILYAMPPDDVIDQEWVDCINRQYDQCIAPNDYVKQQLLQVGVSIPLCTIELPFYRTKRNFVEEDEVHQADFTIACFSTDTTQLNEIITTCKHIRNVIIPELRLIIVVSPANIEMVNSLKEKTSGVKWITTASARDLLAKGSESIHCYLLPDHHSQWLLDPRQVIYLGIPVIVIDHPVYQNITGAGFAYAIPTLQHLEAGISDIFNNYPYYNDQAIKASAWIEDKWTPEFTFLTMIRLARSVKKQHETINKPAI
ncbi:MAG TPA: glycosyltransferase [Niastella sp.]